MKVEPQKEHRWLEQLVGEWAFETEAATGADTPPVKQRGSETVRSLDGVWVVCEGRPDGSEGGAPTTMVTLGYDPAKQRHVGTFVGSMMTHLWVYDGERDPSANALTLHTEGPGFPDDTKTSRYRDRIEITGGDHRVVTSHVMADDGTWQRIMTTHYRRTL